MPTGRGLPAPRVEVMRSGPPRWRSPGRSGPRNTEPRTHGGTGFRAYASRQSADWISLTSSLFGLAPATDWTGSPFLKTVRVGTDITR